jgi:hypothetical protein
MEPDCDGRDPPGLERHPHDREVRERHARLYAEMLEQLAPATEGWVVNPGHKRRGRLVFGDDTNWSV